MLIIFVVVFLGNVVANFGWQLLVEKDWERALERSFFQFFSLAAVYSALVIAGRT